MKFNSILTVVLFFVLISCGSSKSVIRTTKGKNDVGVVKRPPSEKPTEIPDEKKPEEPPTTVDITSDANNEVILKATTRVVVTNEMVLAYIDRFSPIAKSNMISHKIPASITLAQGILESGSGTGPLSVQANNHFGIKCHKEWTGKSVRYDDDEANECFRKYNDPNESYSDHSAFLTSRPWYAKLFKLDITDYKAWARGLKAAGYATDPGYPQKLIGLIERYNLSRFDREVLGLPEFKPETKQDQVVSGETRHIVVQGETLYAISKKYNVTVDSIIANNNLNGNTIAIGQELIIK